MDISKGEIEQVVSDVIVEGYIKSYLNPKFVTVDSEYIRMADVLLVKSSLSDELLDFIENTICGYRFL